jgi:hypothetical protein
VPIPAAAPASDPWMTGAAALGLAGPLTVRRDGAAVVIPAGRQSALLAALLLSPGRSHEAGAVAARLADLRPSATHAGPGAIAAPGGGRGSVGKGAARWAAGPVREEA